MHKHVCVNAFALHVISYIFSISSLSIYIFIAYCLFHTSSLVQFHFFAPIPNIFLIISIPTHLSNFDPLRSWAIRRLVYSGSSALFEKLKPLRDKKSEDSAATGKRDSNYQEFNGQ